MRLKGISRLPAEKVYLALTAGMALAHAVMFTTLAVYYVQRVHMNPLQLVLVGTVLELTILIFEIPTGVVADTYSRRLSVILGMFVLSAAWLLEGSLPVFGFVLAAEVVRGVGETFLSGALDAWLADEVGGEHVGRIYIRAGQLARITGIVGTVISVALASLALNLPVLAGGGIFLSIGVFLAFAMPETGFTCTQRQPGNLFAPAMKTFASGARLLRSSSLLLTLFLVNFVTGAASEGYDRLWEAHILNNFRLPVLDGLQPVVWFGIFGITSSLISTAVVALARRRMEAAAISDRSAARLLLLLNLAAVASQLVFAVTGNFWVMAATLMVTGSLYALYYPLYDAWLVRQVEPSLRATMLSMVSQGNALGQTLGGPGVGLVGNRVSLRAALGVASLLLLPRSALFAGLLRNIKPEAQPEIVVPEPEEQPAA